MDKYNELVATVCSTEELTRHICVSQYRPGSYIRENLVWDSSRQCLVSVLLDIVRVLTHTVTVMVLNMKLWVTVIVCFTLPPDARCNSTNNQEVSPGSNPPTDSPPTDRVIIPEVSGGGEARPNQFPYLARLLITDSCNRNHQCGGSLITRKHLATARHCFYRNFKDGCELNFEKYCKNIPGACIAYLRDHYTETEDPGEVWIDISAVYLVNNSVNVDIAIIELEREVILDEKAEIIEMSRVSVNIGDSVRTAGWGQTGPNQWPTVLHMADLIVSNVTDGEVETTVGDNSGGNTEKEYSEDKEKKETGE